MFDLSGLANNISSQVIILSTVLELTSLVVAIATQGTAWGIATVCLILILVALVLVLRDAEKIDIWLKNLIFRPNTGFTFPIEDWRSWWNMITYEDLNSLTGLTVSKG